MYQLHSCLGNCHHLVRLAKSCLSPSTRQWLNSQDPKVKRKDNFFLWFLPLVPFLFCTSFIDTSMLCWLVTPLPFHQIPDFSALRLVGWFGLLTSGFEVGAKKCGVIPMYSKCKTQKGSKMIKFLHLDKCYILQKLSDPIRCKAEKGFSAESSPMNKRSFELWGKVFIHIGWPLIV